MSPSQRYRLHSHLPEVPRLDQRHWEEAWRKYEAAVVPTTKKTEADEDGAADAKAKENEPEEKNATALAIIFEIVSCLGAIVHYSTKRLQSLWHHPLGPKTMW